MAAMTKDPNKPRGRTSSYAFFVAKCREEHKLQHPGTSVGFAEFSKKCSESWKTISAKDKVKFEDKAKNDKVRYDREMQTYIPPKGAPGKGKKKKDPDAPKRPPSAFFVFCSDHRSRIKEENPGISIGGIAKKLGLLWATQTAKDKVPYEARAAALKEKYERDVAAYKARSGGGGKSEAGKKSGSGRPAPKKAEPVDDDDDDDEEDDDEEDEDDDDYDD